MFRFRPAPIYVQNIPHGLKGIKGYSKRQQKLHHVKFRTGQMIDGVNGKICIFQYSQDSKIQNQGTCHNLPHFLFCFFPVLFLPGNLFHSDAGQPGSHCGKQQKTGSPDSSADIINVTESQQPHPLVFTGYQIIPRRGKKHKHRKFHRNQ